ncbi:asparagine synthase (glutamine-hydrolyzing) [candidate division KSB1 bacterium]|nr:asparagine synthase (glutamine-hydrolyzing) [candidate division KSB1 bacterium]
MCGICGIIDIKNQHSVDQFHLTKMTDTMVHRGPDDSGIYLNSENKVGFGFRRLSIIDLQGGHQPMSNEDSSVWIVFNGEIYNHKDLRNELKNKGHHFRTQADTESIIHGYEEWGDDVFRHLRGMFAFAIWDENRRRIILVRDRLGIKPLYYYHDGSRFIFASEIKAILSLPDINKKVDEEALYHYLTLAVTPTPMTMFRSVEKLEPGHIISIEMDGQIKKSKYWEPIITDDYINKLSEKDIIDKLREMLRESIRLRMMSDVPFGVFLSGGVDSSLNVALMNELMDRPVDTFSVSIKDDPLSDERSEAKAVAEYFSTNHHEIAITSQDFIDFLPEMVKYQDEPLADPVCVPIHFVSKLARENGTYVIQVSEGADELFAGYSLYGMFSDFYSRYYKPFSKMPSFIKNISLGLSRFILPQKKLKYIEWAVENKELFWGGAIVFSDKEKLELLGNDHPHDTYTQVIKSHYKTYDEKKPASSFIDRIIYLELKHRLPELLLMRVDKMAMATSVETRVPYLDQELVEFALSIPSDLKYRNGVTKHILKEAAKGIIPDHVIERKKTGFCGSAGNMVSNTIVDYAEHLINGSDWMAETFNIDYMNTLLTEHRYKKKDHGMNIWSILNLASWYQHWFE